MPAPAVPANPVGHRSGSRLTARELIVAALAVIGFWVATWTAAKDLPAVADEIAHITGGESYWRYGINHLQPENGYLAMHWSTLPLRSHPPVLPTVSPDLPQGSAMIVVGNQFFYDLGNDAAAMLSAGRAMMAVVGAALVGLIWWWARRLWGSAGGMLAAVLAALCPTLLAHGGLVMSDVTLSFFLLLTVTLWWHLLYEISVARIALCGLALGALLLSKMSGVLVAPMLLALAIIRAGMAEPLAWHLLSAQSPVTGVRKLSLIGIATVATSAVAALLLWAAFGFHYSMFANAAAPAPRLDVTWENLLQDGSIATHLVGGLRAMQLLPEAWLRGFAQTIYYFRDRQSFLNGQVYLGGSFGYFPYAWLVKTPPALFGLMAFGLLGALEKFWPKITPPPRLAAGSIRNIWRLGLPLIMLFAIYWGFALTTQINIGHRHLLPIYAPMLILAGGAAKYFQQTVRAGKVLIVLLVVWLAAESWSIRPHYLSYFNLLAGGPANGYRHLVDSNVDVGQDLIALGKWLGANAAARGKTEPVFLTFFGPADPVAYGIRATRFADHGFDARPRALPAIVRGGWYCISVTLFQGIYTLAPGPWTRERETLYQQLLALATTRAPSPAEATTLEHLQFARLRHVLAHRQPDARIGYSILIFRLADSEVARALYAPLDYLARPILDHATPPPPR